MEWKLLWTNRWTTQSHGLPPQTEHIQQPNHCRTRSQLLSESTHYAYITVCLIYSESLAFICRMMWRIIWSKSMPDEPITYKIDTCGWITVWPRESKATGTPLASRSSYLLCSMSVASDRVLQESHCLSDNQSLKESRDNKMQVLLGRVPHFFLPQQWSICTLFYMVNPTAMPKRFLHRQQTDFFALYYAKVPSGIWASLCAYGM